MTNKQQPCEENPTPDSSIPKKGQEIEIIVDTENYHVRLVRLLQPEIVQIAKDLPRGGMKERLWAQYEQMLVDKGYSLMAIKNNRSEDGNKSFYGLIDSLRKEKREYRTTESHGDLRLWVKNTNERGDKRDLLLE